MADKTYKQLEKELESILNRVESGDYDELDMLLRDYEKGSELIAQMQKQLDTAKNKIKKVK